MEKAMAMALVVFLLAVDAGLSEGAVYKVGDALGWTIFGSPNYTAWSLSKNFEVGDTISFEYNKKFHNVLEVSKADYSTCNAASPKATYASGNDSITIKSKGRHYFLCGVPGHCTAGQKVDIRVSSSSSSSAAPSISPAPSYSPASPPSGGGSGGGVSPPASPPKANGGTNTRPIPGGIDIVLALFTFTAMASGLVMH